MTDAKIQFKPELISSDKLGWIFEIQRLSTEDGPGIRTTVFFKECPLRCIWCHNPESIWKQASIQWFREKCISCHMCLSACSQNAITFTEVGLEIDRDLCTACGDCIEKCPSTALKKFGEYWSIEELFTEIDKDRVYYNKSGGGVTVSGGEPTLQMDFLLQFLKICKENNISTALDTCGLSSRTNYEKLIPYVDIFLLDIKEIDPIKHKAFVGYSNDKILENIKWLSSILPSQKKELWIRTPIIPRYTATEENIRGIAKFIVNDLDNQITRWDILAFNNLARAKYERMDIVWDLSSEPLLTKEDMEKFYNVAIEEGIANIEWSGLTRKEI